MNLPELNGHVLGWLRDWPDKRDYEVHSPQVRKFLLDAPDVLPSAHSIMRVAPVKEQGNIGSCCANAGLGMYETLILQVAPEIEPLSRLFLYKVLRNLLGWTGDTGAYLRTTMQGLAMFGAPPEANYPYVTKDFDKEPSAFHYALAQSYQALTYYRLDPNEKDALKVLDSIKLNLVANRPVMFGFTVFNNIRESNGDILLPGKRDYSVGGHAMYITGYSDDRKVGDVKGAFIGPNSWGTEWGHKGYYALPYEYLFKGYADDFWTAQSAEWVDVTQFR